MKSFIDTLSSGEVDILNEYFTPMEFAAGTCIIREGDSGDGGYIIDEGEVRLELQDVETRSESVLCYLEAGEFLGEFSLIDGRPRSASAFAQTNVKARWLSTEKYEALCEDRPEIGIKIAHALAKGLSGKQRSQNQQIAAYLFAEDIDPETNEMVAGAVAAQKEFENWTDDAIDALLVDIAGTVRKKAKSLARETVKDTKIGTVEDKTVKIRFACKDVLRSIKGKQCSGYLTRNENRQVRDIASPMGVIVGIIPVTNPIETIVFKTLISLKSRNACIFSCHRDALQVGCKVGEIIREVLVKHNAPPLLVEWIAKRVNRKKTAMLMKHPDVAFILATGGPGIVRAAYSSGTPSIGVGAGNAPVWVTSQADVAAAAEKIVASKSFDCGVICGSENNLVVDASVREQFVSALVSQGAAVLSPEEKQRFMSIVFDPETGHLQRNLVGQTAEVLAEAASITRPDTIRLIVVPATREEIPGPLGHEKLAPILSLFETAGDDDSIAICRTILLGQGIGHTAIIHTQNEQQAQRYGLEVPASRILINSGGSTGCIGIGTGLTPSLTLGCGTYGGNSTTDNVSYKHLMNIKRLAHYKQR